VRQHRPLSDHERAIVERLLSLDFPDVECFRRQVPAITVTDKCPCGCGTIRFAVDPAAPPAPQARWKDTMGPLVEGDEHNWLMLFQVDGVLTELEHVSGGRGRSLDVVDARTIEAKLGSDDS
jgi:hypothetical protein